MNARTRLVLSLLPASAALLLASCATTHDRAMRVVESGATQVDDTRYIQVVESLAARRGVRVHWVNPPKVPADG